ncbi:MAG: 23S rRNA (guanosine(2251)-2'-O)-methyltransferase RlmB [Deltaproteobacteria bacterium]|nr:23S rRNA (guanosine(2251)-2'-O)-methyltransferase RlmB [Deltaproteobacteria bacterium]
MRGSGEPPRRQRPAVGLAAGARDEAPGSGPATERLAGQHVVREALRARRRRLVRLVLEDGRRMEEARDLAALAAAAGVEVAVVPHRRLGEIAGAEARSQGAMLEAGPLPELVLADLLTGDSGTRRLVALDGVEDPQNLGAIARVADAAGASGLILTRRRAPPLSPAVSRASAGAIEHLPVARVPNLPRALLDLREAGFWSLGAEPDAEADLFSASDRLLSGDLVVVLGAEGRGLRRGVRAVLDHEVRIPMAGRVDSLNVSTAAAVVLFELLRRGRGGAGG